MKVKIIFSILVSFLITNVSLSQDQFNVQIEPLIITNAPSIHSFSWGKTSDGKWVILGGRIDGLHQRQPFSAFQESDNNKNVFVIDPEANQTWSASISVLQATIFEQLQSTNQEFYQRGNTLYIIGGYGFSAIQNDHITHNKLTAIDIDGLATAVINSQPITSFFRQITNTNLAVTGGQLGVLDDVFYLCGGHYFEGRYNPMETGFIQKYTDEIRTFQINDNGTALSIINYSAQKDIDNLHRRDYNLAAQVFTDGTKGFTMFSGVFQHTENIPWLNTVDILSSGYTVNNSFNQYLSQYHSANIPIYDTNSNIMHTLFFGGMSQYKLDENENLIQDDNIPFVKTISKVSRFSDGSMMESSLEIEMPAFLGSGAEFIPLYTTSNYLTEEILDLNNLQQGKVLVGYIFGGIESTQENIFFINDGTQSSASNLAFKVFINKTSLGFDEVELNTKNIYNLKVYPNPSSDVFFIEIFIPNTEKSTLDIYNILGKKVKSVKIKNTIGLKKFSLDLSNMVSGAYILKFKNSANSIKKKLIKL
ncbi:hypothetical protein BTO04_11410 [Polaribacter sp. SA4-10]|uniref:T9SS type A sorting domain-containing protein n=1 Tax=Polaribacter sp. SA4-10 TaxID=754397 RepID=UPI000B3BE4C2|nr:T9SS type A sorting domain-containing protein [Polaribacter sp. SA4-10]ARV07257.1 hypothetical protein BTO04_11410 [Polaribacter sp. SA4-10]